MQFDTRWPADSVEFCPHPSFQHIFACGTYKLVESDETSPSKPLRLGKCLVFEVTDDHTGSFKLLDESDMPAVLDMKWARSAPSEWPRLAIAEAEGHILVHIWNSDECQLDQVQRIECRPANVLCLSLDWSSTRDSCESERIVVSSSDGWLTVLSPAQDRSYQSLATWHAHDHEPWIAAWDKWNANVIYSGGDDLKLKSWDIRVEPKSPLTTYSRFDGGVTSIQSHPHLENILAVGSYDSVLRIFDTRKLSRPISDIDVGGGVWRVKWHPAVSRKGDLLAACMHDGFKVASIGATSECTNVELLEGKCNISKRYDEHSSLAYGVDWSHMPLLPEQTSLIASCSFYDHTLHTWFG